MPQDILSKRQKAWEGGAYSGTALKGKKTVILRTCCAPIKENRSFRGLTSIYSNAFKTDKKNRDCSLRAYLSYHWIGIINIPMNNDKSGFENKQIKKVLSKTFYFLKEFFHTSYEKVPS